MTGEGEAPTARQTELLEAGYRYALEHGLADLSLRPLAAAIGSSPRVLLYLFGSKDGLVRALLARARADELELLGQLRDRGTGRAVGLEAVAEQLWSWLALESHRPLLALWVEGYARSLLDQDGPWADFGRSTVQDWLTVLGAAQPASERDTEAGLAARTLILAVLRGAMLDLLATGDEARVTAAVAQQLAAMRAARAGPSLRRASGK
jgi:AcrR family transcriptional regulator